MNLTVLAVGDVVAAAGLSFCKAHLPALREQVGADFVVVNGENAANLGIRPEQAEILLEAGADAITLGNHTWSRREIIPMLEREPRLIRPANFAPHTPGRGWAEFDTVAGPVAVVNLIGRCGMDFTPDNPFPVAERLLRQIRTKIILVDFHAEATSEKLAMGYFLDGRASALWGTHTHVPTADTQILPQGTGYQTDLGMTGPMQSVLGIRPELSINKFRGGVPARYEPAPGPVKLEGAVFTIDAQTGLCIGAERVSIHD